MSDQIGDKPKNTISEETAAAAYDRRFRKYRQLILLLLIAAVLFVIGFLVYGAAKSVRGGAWSKDARFCRCGTRCYYAADARFNFIGFRVALVKAR